MTSKPQIVLLWRWYRALPLAEQFYVEWVAFGIVCLMWAFFVVILTVML